MRIYVLLSLVIFFRSFIGEVYLVNSNSMMNTLSQGDLIWVNKLSYKLELPENWNEVPIFGKLIAHYNPDKVRRDKKAPKPHIKLHPVSRRDIVLMKNPSPNSNYLVKRVVGLPGETIEIINNKVWIDGKYLDELNTSFFPYKFNLSEAQLTQELAKNRISKDYFLMTEKEYESIRLDLGVKGDIRPTSELPTSSLTIFPYEKRTLWSINNYGPMALSNDSIDQKLFFCWGI